MIPLAIVLALWGIATAGSLLAAWQDQEKKKAAAEAERAALEFALDLPEDQKRLVDVPGVSSALTEITGHVGQFEHVAEPKTDLEYAKSMTAPTVATPQLSAEDLTAAEACFGSVKGDDRWPECGRFDMNGDGLIDVRDMIALSKFLGPGPTDVESGSGADPLSAAEVLAGQKVTGMLGLAAAHTPGILAEAASLGQIESVTWTIMDLTNASGLPDIVKRSNLLPWEISVFGPARYHYNRAYRPMQPALKDLPRMLARAQISVEEYFLQAAYQGSDDRWAVAEWNSFLRLPGYRELQIMRWRELIDDTTFKESLLKDGFHPDVVDEMLALTWQIPPYPDLITLMVREIISPDEFITWIGRQGFGPGWAAALYDAHFRLPGYGNLVDALHRGLITEEEIHKYIFWWDYKPTPRPGIEKSDLEIMRGLFKTLIPRVDLRWGFRIGKLSQDQLIERYGWLGYEEDAELMTDIQIARATAAERRTLSTQYLRALRQGTRTAEEIRTKLKALKFPELSINMMIEAELLRREIGSVEVGEEARTLSTAQVLTAFRKNLLSLESARNLLTSKGWASWDANVLIGLNTPRPEEARPAREIRSAAGRLYREGYLDPDIFEGLLRAANYSEAEISQVLESEELRYWFDYVQDLERSDIEAYKKDVLTLGELEERLIARGLRPERARAKVAKEAYKKLPKLKPSPA